MYLIRDVFRCKPGKAGALAKMFLQTVPSMESEDGFRNVRVMTDAVATYWTVVLQAEVDDLAKFEGHMRSFSARPEVKEALAGYMDLVDGGHREIYRIVE
jgi:quinol monooxygenase YgiN